MLPHVQSRTREVAALAGLVLEGAEQGDPVAAEIVARAASELALAVRAVRMRLKMEVLPIAFAGGLLSFLNPLSKLLCDWYILESLPLPKYPASLGAAILALDLLKKS